MPVQNERHSYSINGTPTSGSSTVTYPPTAGLPGGVSAALTIAMSAAQVKTALLAIAPWNTADLLVSGGPFPAAVTVEFQGKLGNMLIPLPTIQENITGGDLVVTRSQTGTANKPPRTTERPTATKHAPAGPSKFPHNKHASVHAPTRSGNYGKAKNR